MRRARTARAFTSKAAMVSVTMWDEKIASSSSRVSGAAARMRPFCALPVRSVTTRKGAPASASVSSRLAPRPVGEAKAAASTGGLRDAIGIGTGEMLAGRTTTPGVAGKFRPAKCRSTRVVGAPGTMPSSKFSNRLDRSRLSPPRPRSATRAAEFGSGEAFALFGTTLHHVAETGMQRQLCECATGGGDAPGCVERVEIPEERHGFRTRRAGRADRGSAAARVRHAPSARSSARPVRSVAEDLRQVEGLERGVLALVPQPIAGAGRRAASTAAALIGPGARDTAGFERAHAGGGFVGRGAAPAGIDDDGDTLDGERGFGDGRGEHDFAAASGPRARWRRSCSVGVSWP